MIMDVCVVIIVGIVMPLWGYWACGIIFMAVCTDFPVVLAGNLVVIYRICKCSVYIKGNSAFLLER
jgi:hypothetical protein